MNNKYGILEYKLEDWHPNKYGYKSINLFLIISYI